MACRKQLVDSKPQKHQSPAIALVITEVWRAMQLISCGEKVLLFGSQVKQG
jgi:hypothetical protein